MPTTGYRFILTIICFFLFFHTMEGQFVSHEIIVNSEASSTFESTLNPIITDFPENGNAGVGLVGNKWKYVYQPDSNFTGRDTFSIEIYNGFPPFWEISYLTVEVLVKNSVLNTADDYAVISAGANWHYLEVLNNDTFSNGPLSIEKVVHSENVETEIDSTGTSLKIKSDVATDLGYAVLLIRDSLGYRKPSFAYIQVIDTSTAVSDDTTHLVLLENGYIDFALKDTNYSLTLAPSHGTVHNLGDFRKRYRPTQGYFGPDTLVFTGAGGESSHFFIKIIETGDPNTILVDDYIYIPRNTSDTFDVKANDISDNFLIKGFGIDTGTIMELSEGVFSFVPDSAFSGLATGYYTIKIGNTTEKATIYIYVDDLNPQDYNPYQLSTLKNQPLVINYDVPISNFTFNQNLAPAHGNLTLLPGVDSLQIGCNNIRGYEMVVYFPDTGFIGLDSFQLEYCIPQTNHCEVVSVHVVVIDIPPDTLCPCLQNCVWPGDADDDGAVSMRDLLSLGYFTGEAGKTRPFASDSIWKGQNSPEWPMVDYPYSSNLKYMDSDGDGILDAKDVNAIDYHYQLVHSLLPPVFANAKPYPLFLEYTGPPNPQIGDLVTFNIHAGTEDFPVVDMSGLSFGLYFDTSVVDISTLNIQVLNNSWLTRYHPNISLVKSHSFNGVDVGISKMGGITSSGFGVVATCDFIIENDIDGLRAGNTYPMEISFRNNYSFGNEGLSTLPGKKQYFDIYLKKVNRPFDEDLVKMFPNPASSGSNITIMAAGEMTINKIYVGDINGRMIQTHRYPGRVHKLIFTAPKEAGIYFLVIETDKGTAFRKLIVSYN